MDLNFKKGSSKTGAFSPHFLLQRIKGHVQVNPEHTRFFPAKCALNLPYNMDRNA